MKQVILLLNILFTFLVSNNVQSCTTVFANNKGPIKVVARTMDLYRSDEPIIKVLPRAQRHTGNAGTHELTWTSKYGSVVITAFHTPTTSDGMNEKGLAAHLLYLTDSKYPSPTDNTPRISNTTWAQYMLDNFQTVKETLENTKDLMIVATEVAGRTWPAHLTLEDATGDSAIIEFIEGKPKIYHGKQYQVMTNEPPYDVQLDNLKHYKSFGGTRPLPGDTDPLSRFVRVATYLKQLPNTKEEIDAIAGLLSVIRSAMVPFGAEDTSGNKTEDAWSTRWVSAADLTNQLYFFNSTTAPNIVWVNLKEIDFSENATELTIDPTNITLTGNITKQMKQVTESPSLKK